MTKTVIAAALGECDNFLNREVMMGLLWIVAHLPG
jgi:hypothetical protein